MQIWKKLAHEAEEAYHQGNHRLSASKYLMSFRAVPDKWEFKRYHVLHGYTSAFTQQYIPAGNGDMKALKAIADDPKELKLNRCEAAYTYGFMSSLRGDREEASEYYREVVRIADKAKRKECRYKVLATLTTPDGSRATGVAATMMGDLLDNVRNLAQWNLEHGLKVYDDSDPHSSLPSSRNLSDAPPSIRVIRTMTKVPLNKDMTKESAAYLLSVGGDKCDCCQQSVKELSKSLDRCARCAKAWYCGKDCQLKQWKAGHNKCCRKPGQIRVGDYVQLKGLQSELKFDRLMAKVIGPDPQNEGHWEVEIGGDDESEKASVPGSNMRQLRPLK